MNRSIALSLVGFLLGGILLLLAFRRLSWEEIQGTLRAAELWPWLGLAVLSYVAGHIVRGLRCRWLVEREARIGTLEATHVVVVGYAVNNLLPARLGELARAGLLSRRTGLPFLQSLTITFVERFFDVIVLLFFASLSLRSQGDPPWAWEAVRLAAALGALASLALVLGVWSPSLIQHVTSVICKALTPGSLARAMVAADRITHGLAPLRRPRLAARVLAASVAIWLLEGGLFFFMLPAIGLAAKPASALLTLSLTNLGILIPSMPGYIGSFHFFCRESLVTTGATPTEAAAFALLTHAAFFVPVTLWGLAVLAATGFRTAFLGIQEQQATTLDLERFRMHDRIEVHGAVSPRAAAGGGSGGFASLTRALTSAAVPAELVADASVRERAIDVTAGFVQAQLDALPTRLRWMMRAGLFFFQSCVILRHGSRFGGLSGEHQREIFEWWAHGPVPLFRQLFRPLRSLALLAWHEQPEVLQTMIRSPGGGR